MDHLKSLETRTKLARIGELTLPEVFTGKNVNPVVRVTRLLE